MSKKVCAACSGTGSTIARQRLEDLVSLLMLSGSDAFREKCHPYFYDMPIYNSAGKVCGRDMVALTSGLAGRPPMSLGHDACDKWAAVRKIVAAAGLPESWGECLVCKGEGEV
jgi:hypothetical protein